MLCLWLLVSSLLITASYGAEESGDAYLTDECMIGNLASDLDGKMGTSQVKVSKEKTYILMDYVMSCDGSIGKWQFYAKKTGYFLALVFRPRRELSKFDLVGYNVIKVEAKGVEVIEIPSVERIDVITGDRIALAFPDDFIVSMVALTGHSPAGGSRIHEVDIIPEDGNKEEYLEFPYPETVTGPEYAASIAAFVTGPSPFIRLALGEHHSGVAEKYGNGEWARMCDTWFHILGWPNIFCKNLGFPGSAMARYVRHNEIEYRQPLTMKNLRCKASITKILYDCHLLKNDKCDHERQVFVECERKVRLVGGPNRCVGVAEIWKFGTWNTICDALHDPQWHKQHPDQSWTSAFCRELGCDKYATFVGYAKDEIRSYTPSVRTTYSTPNCTTKTIISMADCPRLRGQECSHSKDFYIKCGTSNLK